MWEKQPRELTNVEHKSVSYLLTVTRHCWPFPFQGAWGHAAHLPLALGPPVSPGAEQLAQGWATHQGPEGRSPCPQGHGQEEEVSCQDPGASAPFPDVGVNGHPGAGAASPVGTLPRKHGPSSAAATGRGQLLSCTAAPPPSLLPSHCVPKTQGHLRGHSLASGLPAHLGNLPPTCVLLWCDGHRRQPHSSCPCLFLRRPPRDTLSSSPGKTPRPPWACHWGSGGRVALGGWPARTVPSLVS